MHAGNGGQSMALVELGYVPLVKSASSNWHSAHLLTLRVNGERTADTGDTRFTEALAVRVSHNISRNVDLGKCSTSAGML